jgi:hypothetical protein
MRNDLLNIRFNRFSNPLWSPGKFSITLRFSSLLPPTWKELSSSPIGLDPMRSGSSFRRVLALSKTFEANGDEVLPASPTTPK